MTENNFINKEVTVPKDQITELGDCVTEIITFSEQLKTYTTSAIEEHDKAISTLSTFISNEGTKLAKRVRVLTAVVIALVVVTAGMAVYLCLRH